MPIIKCVFCGKEAEGSNTYLDREGWLRYNVRHKNGANEVRFIGAGCKEHRKELVAQFDHLMSKNILKQGGDTSVH